MKLLLDTHIWLWYLLGHEQLSPSLRTIISSQDTEIWLSPVSIWEAMILEQKGRITLYPDALAWINQALEMLKTQEASLNFDIAILSRQIKLPKFNESNPNTKGL